MKAEIASLQAQLVLKDAIIAAQAQRINEALKQEPSEMMIRAYGVILQAADAAQKAQAAADAARKPGTADKTPAAQPGAPEVKETP